MERKLVQTADGSNTLYIATLDEHYHSIHGALQESMWVFIGAGLQHFPADRDLRVLEVGFGTGLNAWLTMLEKQKRKGEVHYHALEAFPLQPAEYKALDYSSLTGDQRPPVMFEALHTNPWEVDVKLFHGFTLKKTRADLVQETLETSHYDLIYFDAFAPDAQPELWTTAIFAKLFEALRPGGILVTYCAKGYVKRNMKAAGFHIDRLPGPKGKREMTRAVKR